MKRRAGAKTHRGIGARAKAVMRRAFAAAVTIVLVLGNALGLMGPAARAAWATGGDHIVEFANGGTATAHGDGSITGTCTTTAPTPGVPSENIDWDAMRLGMPDGQSVPARCYERWWLKLPDHDNYVWPAAGSYGFTATPNGDGTYFVLVHSEDAPPFNGIQVTGYKRQRVYTERWEPEIVVNVGFTKVSANASVTDDNAEYAYAGAVYDIYNADNNQKVASITTGENGHADLKLGYGSYYAVEAKAPQGFIVNPEHIPFEVTAANQSPAVNLADTPGRVTITIKKHDAATGGAAQPGTSLQGAEFTLVDANGAAHTGTTDAEGQLAFDVVPLGQARITETKAPVGYKLDSTVHTYTVHADQLTGTGIIELTPDGDFPETVIAFDLEIVKYRDSGDEGSGLQNPAQGVRFDIISNTTGKTVGTIETDENGHATTHGQWFGEGSRAEGIAGALPYDAKGYTVHEDPATTPEGYQAAGDWQITSEQMTDGATLHYIVGNDFVSSRIQVVKTDAASGQTVPLAGFTFQLLDKDKQPITQEVWYPNHSEVTEFTTDETGTVTFPEALLPGVYYLREIKAPAPYLCTDEDLRIVIENDADVDPVTVVTVADKQAYGTAKIAKACTESKCPWHEDANGLAGAEFDVVAREDIVSPDGTVQAVNNQVLDHLVTGDDGTATTGTPLPLGRGTATYAFIETKAPAGHVLDPTPIEFTLSWADDATATVFAEASAKDAPTEITVDKAVAGSDEPLAETTFDLWPEQATAQKPNPASDRGAVAITFRDSFEHRDELADTSISLTPHHEDDADDDAERQTPRYEGSAVAFEGDIARIEDIEPGTYDLNVRGYGADATMTLTIDGGVWTSVSATSDGTVARTGHTLAPYMQAALDCMYRHLGIDLTTDENGAIAIRHLPATGTDLAKLLQQALGERDLPDELDLTVLEGSDPLAWCLQETNAPDGFLVDPFVRSFTIGMDGTVDGNAAHHIAVENDYTKVEISKRDSTNESPVEGAVLSVTDSKGASIDTWTSTREPHRIDKIAPGTYTLSETTAPATHDDAADVTFTVEATGNVQTVTLYDEPIKITGEIDKQQEIARPIAASTHENGDGKNRAAVQGNEDGSYRYSLDYRSTASTWVDEFTVTDDLAAAHDGFARLTGITTAQARGDYDGLMNVWYQTNRAVEELDDMPQANATLDDGHQNPRLTMASTQNTLGDDGRALDYADWRLWASDVPTTQAAELSIGDLDLAEEEYITAVRFEYGRVDEDFTTRLDGWERDDLHDEHDDVDEIEGARTSDPSTESAAEFTGAPAVFHMQATDAYTGDAELENRAQVDLFRNGGGHDLEDHDADRVVQSCRTVLSVLDQTGAGGALPILVAGILGTGLLYLYLRQRRTISHGPDPRGPRRSTAKGNTPRFDRGRRALR